MKSTSTPNLVEKEADTVKVQFNRLIPSLGIFVFACAEHLKNDEICSAVRDAGYIVESYRGGSYCVTGGTPKSLEILADQIRAAYAGEEVDSDAAKLNEIVKLLILSSDHPTPFSASFDAVQSSRTCRAVARHLDTAKKILEVLR